MIAPVNPATMPAPIERTAPVAAPPISAPSVLLLRPVSWEPITAPAPPPITAPTGA